MKNSFCGLLKKTSEARRAKMDERRRTCLYVDAKSVKRNEAYESFSVTSTRLSETARQASRPARDPLSPPARREKASCNRSARPGCVAAVSTRPAWPHSSTPQPRRQAKRWQRPNGANSEPCQRKQETCSRPGLQTVERRRPRETLRRARRLTAATREPPRSASRRMLQRPMPASLEGKQ